MLEKGFRDLTGPEIETKFYYLKKFGYSTYTFANWIAKHNHPRC